MRTSSDILNNIKSIRATMIGLKTQMATLEEYQKCHIENVGERNPDWDEQIESLRTAWNTLNGLFHMEMDALDDIENI